MTGAAGPLAVETGECYHDRRGISAAIDGWCVGVSGVDGVVCLMREYRSRGGSGRCSPEGLLLPTLFL